MNKNQNGFILILIALACLVITGFIGWYVFARPSMESHSQLARVIDAIKVPPSYKITKTSFSEANPELTTTFSITRDYEVTTPTTRAEALLQIIKSLGLNPENHQTVNIYEEQLNGTSSPLFPSPGSGSSFKFSAKLEPSYSGSPVLNQCEGKETDSAYRACVNNDKTWGKDSLVKKIEITVYKEPS